MLDHKGLQRPDDVLAGSHDCWRVDANHSTSSDHGPFCSSSAQCRNQAFHDASSKPLHSGWRLLIAFVVAISRAGAESGSVYYRIALRAPCHGLTRRTKVQRVIRISAEIKKNPRTLPDA